MCSQRETVRPLAVSAALFSLTDIIIREHLSSASCRCRSHTKQMQWTHMHAVWGDCDTAPVTENGHWARVGVSSCADRSDWIHVQQVVWHTIVLKWSGNGKRKWVRERERGEEWLISECHNKDKGNNLNFIQVREREGNSWFAGVHTDGGITMNIITIRESQCRHHQLIVRHLKQLSIYDLCMCVCECTCDSVATASLTSNIWNILFHCTSALVFTWAAGVLCVWVTVIKWICSPTVQLFGNQVRQWWRHLSVLREREREREKGRVVRWVTHDSVGVVKGDRWNTHEHTVSALCVSTSPEKRVT